MSPHILTMIVLLANGDVRETRIGVMDNRPFCDLAGLGVTRVLVAKDPTLVVGWTCEPVGVRA